MDNTLRQKRHRRIRSRVAGSASRPRVSVFRSLKHITVQLIDDQKGVTLLAALDDGKGAKTKRARQLGVKFAKSAQGKGVKTVVFDRGGYKYQGRVKALSEGLREGGLEF